MRHSCESLNNTHSILLLLALLLAPCLHAADATAERVNRRDTATLTGEVVAADSNMPLASANVLVKGSVHGASTNLDGRFRISGLQPGEVTVLISTLGYAPKRLTVTLKPNTTEDVQVNLEPDILKLGAVVITGTAVPTIYEESTVRTSVIARESMEQAGAVALADALDFETGVRVENNCNNCNFTQVRMNGLEGAYSQVLIDGAPVISNLAGVYGLEQLPEAMIEQVEVVKGGGSALYGGGAVAGTINLRTRVPNTSSAEVSYDARSIGGEAGAHKVDAILEKPLESGGGLILFGTMQSRQAYDHNDDGYSEVAELSAQTVGFTLHAEPWRNGQVRLEGHHMRESRRGGNDFDLPKHEANIAEAVDHVRWGGSVNVNHRFDFVSFDADYALQLLERDSYYGGLAEDTPEARLEAMQAYGYTSNPVHYASLQATSVIGDHALIVGVGSTIDQLEDRTTRNPEYWVDESIEEIGVYLQDNVQWRSLDLVAGARIDQHSELDDPVLSPRLAMRLDVVADLQLRASVSTGFRAPQTFDEDLHIETLGADQRVIRNARGLVAEKSLSFSAGAEWTRTLGYSRSMLLSANLFRTQLGDPFAIELISAETDHIYERINASESATVEGVELEAVIRLAPSLECRFGWTLQRHEYDTNIELLPGVTHREFLRTPESFGNLQVTWDATSSLTLFSALRYTGSARMLHEEPADGSDPELKHTGSFTEIDLGASRTFDLSDDDTEIVLNAGVRNLLDAYQDDLDHGSARDAAYVYGPTLPRTWRLGVSLRF